MTNLFAKVALWGLAVIAVLYAALCVVMFFQQRRLMYFPQMTRVEAAHTNFSLQQAGVTLRGWQSHPQAGPTARTDTAGAPGLAAATAPARDAVIYLGGNAERVEQAVPLLHQWLPTHSVYALAYRGYGASDGMPTGADLERDAIALFDAVQQRHPQGRITVVGRSLGTGVAAAVAAQRQPTHLVLITPFDSMVATVRDHYGWLPVGLLLRDRYPSDERLQHYGGPLLVLRAGRDALVLPARTDALERALANRQGPAVEVENFAAADHIDILEAPGLAARLRSFVEGVPAQH
ncbi:alpha/beta hydrolase [Comamonas sp. 4034]|uniref:alpha/beta hydrolase n=1 Tax=Comamonas sp. 4034 TaxID=3156455 RepID=UPI003D1DEE4A